MSARPSSIRRAAPLTTITLALIGSTFISPASAQPIVAETFDATTAGWGFYNDGENLRVDLAFGNPGGALRCNDAGEGGYWGFLAGPALLGDRSCLYGGTLWWDFRTTHTSAAGASEADVALIGNGVTLAIDLPAPSPVNTWLSRSVNLVETAGWRVGTISGAPATATQLQSVLASLTAIRFRGEFSTAIDNAAIDNVILSSFRFSVPAPSAVCPGQTVTLTGAITSGSGNGPFTIAWLKNGEPIINNPSAATLSLELPGVTAADTATYTLSITNACGTATQRTQLYVDAADVGGQGGQPGGDGLRDNNDFIVFIDLFFAASPAADMGSPGGTLGSDGAFDNNDFIVFIDQFFAEC